MRITETEITAPVSLTLPSGRLNPAAVGWSRTPLHDTSGIGRGAFGWGRNKRWEYWGFTTPRHIFALTVSSIDYAAVHSVWVLDRQTGREIAADAIGVLGGSARLPASLGTGPARARTRKLRIHIDEIVGATRVRARTSRVSIDVTAATPPGHEALAVVVPWTDRLFQYTVKDVARPITGRITVDGETFEVPPGESWAVLDHGRGRWPYSMHWNWGAGSGVDAGRVIGVQFGGKWTDGSGATENAIVVDGRLHKISEELAWDYDTADYLAPWRIHGETTDVTFTPFHDKISSTNLGVFASSTHQCFGHYSGWSTGESGERIDFAGILGWAEDVRNRW